ncbi:MAG TPA: hypothetical protein VMW91_05860 [Desulfosporosinus sp.]|nr:hypothetical protein [Desulfosporosinus sp.]
MKAICYKNTESIKPFWATPVHEDNQWGYAYETDTHFVHFYGTNHGLYVISTDMVMTEQKKGTLKDWATTICGAIDFKPMDTEVGQTVDSIWRPCLYYEDEINEALNIDKFEQRSCEQALRILIDKLDSLFWYIEPEGKGLEAYSHKTRELLILACTETENHLKALLKKANASPINGKTFTTKDYVKLCKKAHLTEYQLMLRNYDYGPVNPFLDWNKRQPTQSLPWYDAYNKTKHDRSNEFHVASLNNVIKAIAANIVLYIVRFGPFPLLHGTRTLSSIVNQIFNIMMVDSNVKTFYLPDLDLPSDLPKNLSIIRAHQSGYYKKWKINPLKI